MPDYSPPADEGLKLICCDASLLVVNKPAGLLSVPGRGANKQDCLSARVIRDFPDALTVHRLDMATSGLIVFARGIDMQRRLSEMFRERQVQKSYVAIVEGVLEKQNGEIALPIGADWINRPRQKVDIAQGKAALTRYRLLACSENSSRVALEPVTGRTHQLRVHMAAIGHPILGDALYGDALGAPGLMLHAQSLSFLHPVSRMPLNLQCSAAF